MDVSNRKQGGGWFILSALWWILDGLYKDDFFAWAKPMMPDYLIHPHLLSLLRGFTSFAPPIILAAIGFYFIFLKGEKLSGHSDALRRHFGGSKRMMLWVALTCGILITGTSATALWWSAPSRPNLQEKDPFVKNVAGPPIEWRFDKPVTIFWYARRPGEPVPSEKLAKEVRCLDYKAAA
jgi:hypothetical protein